MVKFFSLNCLQKLQNLWVAKALMNSYILCKILSFLTRVAQKVFNRPGSYSLAELIILWTFNIQNWLICSSIRNRIAYANKANIVNKDSPFGRCVFVLTFQMFLYYNVCHIITKFIKLFFIVCISLFQWSELQCFITEIVFLCNKK